METVPFQYMCCISFVITCISNGCLVLVWVVVFWGFFVWWVFFFPRKIILCFQTIFQALTCKRQDILDQRNFLKSLQTRSHYFNLFLFRKLSYYKTVSDNLAKSDNTPNTLFIKCLYFQEHTEICKQSIFKYAFAINMRLLLLQFITHNMKPIVFPVAVCAQNSIF